jgi:tetratricopeptide (TPR) repeat protein
MKRVLAAVVVLGLTAAAVYGYTVSRRERTFRQLLADGEAALARDNTFAAIEAFSGAIALKDDAMVGYLKRGETYRRRGELDAAMRDLRRAAELDPTATRPREELGDVNLGLKRYARAADQYREYVRLDPQAPRVLYKLAFARYNDGRVLEAIEALQKTVALDDHLPEAYYLLGLCHRDAQHVEAARRALEQSVALQPALLHAREELADLYGTLGRTDDRLNQLAALLALDPSPSRAVTLGLAYARAGQPERAVLTLGGVAERHPEYPYAYVALGRVWLEIAQARNDRVALSKALGALQGSAGTDDSSEALTLFGRALLMTGDADAAERMLLDATEKQPIEPLAFAYLADASERLGHMAGARQALLDYAALRGDETDPKRRTAEAARLGELSLRLNDPAAAASYFLRASEAAGSDATLLARAADAQLRAGDLDTARATITTALEKDPGNATAVNVARRLIPKRM